MNPTRWRSARPGQPTLDRVADCGNHPVNAACPHVSAEACVAVEYLATGLVYVGLGVPMRGHIPFEEAVRGAPGSVTSFFSIGGA